MYEFLRNQAVRGLSANKVRDQSHQSSPSGERGVEDFIVYLASVCDGPRDLDQKGFSVESGPDGHRFAAKIMGGLTTHNHGHSLDEVERPRAFFIAQIHHGQLKEKFGEPVYTDVMRTGKFRFSESRSEDTAKLKFLHYNEFARRIEFDVGLPEDFAHRKQLFADLKDLRRSTGVLLAPESAVLVKMAKDKKFEVVKYSFWKGDAGASKAVQVLRQLGFLADLRIKRALKSPSNAYLSTKISYTKVYDRKILFGYLHHTGGRGELWSQLDDFLRSGNVKGVFSKEVEAEHPGVRLQRFPFGDSVIDGIERILGEHSVDNVDLLRRALRDEERAVHQHHGLQNLGGIEGNGFRR